MLDHDSAVAPQKSCYDGPLRAYERYRTKDPVEASALSAAVLSANQLELTLGNLLLEPPPPDLCIQAGPVAGPARRSLTGAAELLAASYDGKDPGSPLPAAVTRRLEEQILFTVLLSVKHNYQARLRGEEARPRLRTVREAIDLISAEEGATWTIPELARAVGVTVRALELGFRKELGKTPREFVREQRLLRAHDELLRANSGDGTTVTGVACRWGFWHAGRFATSYTERFGVRPATTLRSGASNRTGYTVNVGAWSSLCMIDEELAVDGTEVTVVWGDPQGARLRPAVESPHALREVRAVVSTRPLA